MKRLEESSFGPLGAESQQTVAAWQQRFLNGSDAVRRDGFSKLAMFRSCESSRVEVSLTKCTAVKRSSTRSGISSSSSSSSRAEIEERPTRRDREDGT